MAILNYFKQNKLNEELNIEGLTFIGKGLGWEVYQATTFAGAQQLKAIDPEQGELKAGTAWCTPTKEEAPNDEAAERTFNAYMVGRHIGFYLFVKEGTNEAFYAAIAYGNSILKTTKGFNIIIRNYQIQSVSGSDSKNVTASDAMLPLFLLPNIQYNGHDGLIIQDERILVGTYNGLVNPNNIPTEVKVATPKIKSGVFADYCVATVIIEKEVTSIESNAFTNYNGTIKCAAETPEEVSWASDWNGNNTNIVWGCYLTPEEIARREEEARRREEEERRLRELQVQDAISVLRYRAEGSGITILGIKRGREDIEIPDQINGKPVTKIAPFAFYNNPDLNKVIVPDSVKEIGKAAFYGCNNAKVSYPSTATIFKDAFLGCYSFKAR